LIKQEDDLPAVKDCIAQNDIEIISIFELTKKRDPKRDKFC
jgi:hypothetical protein